MSRSDKIADWLATATMYGAMAAFLVLITLNWPI